MFVGFGIFWAGFWEFEGFVGFRDSRLMRFGPKLGFGLWGGFMVQGLFEMQP